MRLRVGLDVETPKPDISKEETAENPKKNRRDLKIKHNNHHLVNPHLVSKKIIKKIKTMLFENFLMFV